MRKTAALAVAGALTAALGTAGIAQAINGQQTMDIKLLNNKAGTVAKPKSVGVLTVDLHVTPAADDQPFATKATVVHFDKNLVFGNLKFPKCTQAQVSSGAAACTKAKVGSGEASAVLNAPGGKIPVELTVTPFNGPNGQLLLHVKNKPGSAVVDSVIVGKLQPDTGKFGRKLNVTIPANLQQPVTGLYATLTHFLTKVGGVSKGTPFVGLKGCTGGKLQFKGDFTFTDNTKQSPTSTASCKK